MKYAIVSDIHANLEALQVVLDKCHEQNVAQYICLGDIVGYNANPAECLEMMRSVNLVATVKGNHDEYVSNDDEEMVGFNPHARAAVLWTKNQLTEEQRKFLADIRYKMTIRGTSITLVHATLDSPEAWGYIFDVHHATDNFSYQFTQLCFCGHSHVPIAFCKKPLTLGAENPVEEMEIWRGAPKPGAPPEDGKADDSIRVELQNGWKYLINIGSVGQPRNRDPRASFAIYDDEAKVVIRYRLPYDIPAAQSKIRAAGLPDRLATRLERGN
jgi:predicted phosphodiesterase